MIFFLRDKNTLYNERLNNFWEGFIMRKEIEIWKKGVHIGVDWWYIVIGNQKIPKGICWILVIMLLPVNAIIVGILTLFNKKTAVKIGLEVIDELNERKA
jgi:3-phosphoglycerate kinase